MATLMTLLGCGPSLAEMKVRAEHAQLQDDAPIHAEASDVIAAPIASVWSLFSKVEEWPRWNADARGAKIDGPFAAGTAFGYGTRAKHRLTLARVESPTLVSFYGTLSGYKGITIWRLEALSASTTRVRVQESSDGPLISVFYSNKALRQHLELWISALKTEAERRHGDGP